MDAFVWDQRFVTGLETVDAQHRQLVDLINGLGSMLLAGQASDAELQAVFLHLFDYARNHFANEGKLMLDGGIAPAYLATHQAQHAHFVEQLSAMWGARSVMGQSAEILHGFLVAWLSFHILGEDQSMARQLARIDRGESAAAALAAESNQVDNATAALLAALQKLYQVLFLQNQDLARANLSLENKVAERTRELAAANANLAAEQEALQGMLAKVDQAQSQLLQSEKMASIGQLAAGVAHEINNPIGFVTSNLGSLGAYVDRLLRYLDAAEKGVVTEALRQETDLEFMRVDILELLRESQEGLERVRKIVANLKDFSHVDESAWQDADINKGLESTLNVVWNELKYKAEVVREYGKLPLVRCMPAQLNQVFMNLLINAVQAIDQHGRIVVRSGVDGDWVWVEIEDNGAGIPAEVQKRVFEPFFTTKPVGKGTGLGLSLSYDIVHKHGGRFDLKSELNQGTVFRIWLPVAGPGSVNGSDEERG